MKSLRSSLLILLLTVLITSLALAQDQTPTTEAPLVLGYGSPVTGSIDNSNPRNTWPLEVTSLDRISIRVERSSGNLLPDLILRDPNGDEVAQSYGTDNTGAAAEVDNVTLDHTGTYQVLVQRVDFETGLTSGDYSLTVTLQASGEDSEANSTPIGSMDYNTYVEDRITADHWLHQYTFSAAGPDYIRVTGTRDAGTLMPEVEVRDSDGTSLNTGYTVNSGDSATLTYELPQAGQYTVIMTRSRRFDGQTTGTYRLTLDLLGAGEGNPVLDQIAGSVEYDKPLVGQLADGQWYQDWTLTVDAGDVITITEARPLDAASGAGNLRPEVVLLGGSDQELNHGYVDDSGALAVINRYQLAAPGDYIIRAMREGQKTGATSGSYVLTVTLNGSGAGSPGLDESAGTVTLGTPVEGQITDARWTNPWSFSATADQQVDIRVERTDGTFIPHIEIRDANGQSLYSAYPDQTRALAEISNYRFPSTGDYQIVVYRDNQANGYTSGGYRLSVSQTQQ